MAGWPFVRYYEHLIRQLKYLEYRLWWPTRLAVPLSTECVADQLTVTELLKDIGNDPRIEQLTSAVGRLRGLECGGFSSP